MEKTDTIKSGLKITNESSLDNLDQKTPRLDEADLRLCGNCNKCNSDIPETLMPSPQCHEYFCRKYPVPMVVIDPWFRQIYARMNQCGIETCFCCAGHGPTAWMAGKGCQTDPLHPERKNVGNVWYVEGPEHHPADLPMALVVVNERSTELCKRLRKIRVRGVGQKYRQLFRHFKTHSLTGRIRNDGTYHSETADCYHISINAQLVGLPRSTNISDHHDMPDYLWALHSIMRKKWLAKLEEILDKMLHENQTQVARVHIS